MTKIVYNSPYAVYKNDICHPLKVWLEEHWKAVVWGEIEKSAKADNVYIYIYRKEKLFLWDEVKIIDREEVAHMVGYSDLLRRPSIMMYTI